MLRCKAGSALCVRIVLRVKAGAALRVALPGNSGAGLRVREHCGKAAGAGSALRVRVVLLGTAGAEVALRIRVHQHGMWLAVEGLCAKTCIQFPQRSRAFYSKNSDKFWRSQCASERVSLEKLFATNCTFKVPRIIVPFVHVFL